MTISIRSVQAMTIGHGSGQGRRASMCRPLQGGAILEDRVTFLMGNLRTVDPGDSTLALATIDCAVIGLSHKANHAQKRSTGTPGETVKLEAVDQFTPDEQTHVATFIEGALLRHQAKQALICQAG